MIEKEPQLIYYPENLLKYMLKNNGICYYYGNNHEEATEVLFKDIYTVYKTKVATVRISVDSKHDG